MPPAGSLGALTADQNDRHPCILAEYAFSPSAPTGLDPAYRRVVSFRMRSGRHTMASGPRLPTIVALGLLACGEADSSSGPADAAVVAAASDTRAQNTAGAGPTAQVAAGSGGANDAGEATPQSPGSGTDGPEPGGARPSIADSGSEVADGSATSALPNDGGLGGGDTNPSHADSGPDGTTDPVSDASSNDGGEGVADAGGESPGYCPGVEPRYATLTLCSTTAECSGRQQCLNEPVTFACGGIAPPTECATDEECGADRICERDTCGATFCAPACTPTSCGAYTACEQGRCVPLRCDDPGGPPCTAPTVCDPGAAQVQADGCTVWSCLDGFACQLGWDCDPGEPGATANGCLHRACTTASDCDCGSCVNGYCEGAPGFCSNVDPPP